MKNINISLQQFEDLKGSGSVVIGGEYTPGEEYNLQFEGNKIAAKCSSWFGPPEEIKLC